MPIHKVGNKWQWGSHGAKYSSRKGAERQAAAAHANGFVEHKALDSDRPIADNLSKAASQLKRSLSEWVLMKAADDEEGPNWHRHEGGKDWHPSHREHEDPTLHEKMSAQKRQQSGGGRHMAEASARSQHPAPPEFDWDAARARAEEEHPDPFEGLVDEPRARDHMPEREDIVHPQQRSALTQNPPQYRPAPGRAEQRPSRDYERLARLAEENAPEE